MASTYKFKRIRDGEEFPLDRPAFLIGRSDACDISVNLPLVSREHARLVDKKAEGVLVQDLHSTNGTYVNNQQIQSDTLITPGDVIKIGDESFSLQRLNETEATVLMRSLSSGQADASAIVADEDEDENCTSFLQVYSLPPGWGDYDGENNAKASMEDKRKKQALEAYIAKAKKTMKGRYGLALIFFVDDQLPNIKMVSTDDAKESWLIGRNEKCDVVLEHPSISGVHAQLNLKSSRWHIEDKDSKNGILKDNKHQARVDLDDGTTLQIGSVELLVRSV